MPVPDIVSDGPQTTHVRQTLASLRDKLDEARGADDAGRIHLALTDVADGLITHAEQQARAIDDLRSDLTHKQGIVTRIGGGHHTPPASTGKRVEFASSSNGDRWFLGRDDATGSAHVIHVANAPSGGALTRIEIGAFLNRGPAAPEHLGLLRLIGSLVD